MVYYMNVGYIQFLSVSSRLWLCHPPNQDAQSWTQQGVGSDGKFAPSGIQTQSLQVDAGLEVQLLKGSMNSRVCWLLRGVHYLSVNSKLQITKLRSDSSLALCCISFLSLFCSHYQHTLIPNGLNSLFASHFRNIYHYSQNMTAPVYQRRHSRLSSYTCCLVRFRQETFYEKKLLFGVKTLTYLCSLCTISTYLQSHYMCDVSIWVGSPLFVWPQPSIPHLLPIWTST